MERVLHILSPTQHIQKTFGLLQTAFFQKVLVSLYALQVQKLNVCPPESGIGRSFSVLSLILCPKPRVFGLFTKNLINVQEMKQFPYELSYSVTHHDTRLMYNKIKLFQKESLDRNIYFFVCLFSTSFSCVCVCAGMQANTYVHGETSGVVPQELPTLTSEAYLRLC